MACGLFEAGLGEELVYGALAALVKMLVEKHGRGEKRGRYLERTVQRAKRRVSGADDAGRPGRQA